MAAIFPDQREDALSSPAPEAATGVYIDLHSYSRLVLVLGFKHHAAQRYRPANPWAQVRFFNSYDPIPFLGPIHHGWQHGRLRLWTSGRGRVLL